MTKVTFLIAAFGERLLNVPNILLDKHDNIDYVVVAQCVSDACREQYLSLVEQRNDINTIFSEQKGVTKSRNIALKNIPGSTDIVFFLDDDVVLERNCYDTIVSAFSGSDFDVITFTVSTLEGDKLLKNYATKTFSHGKFSILKVGTIEIAARAEIFARHPELCFPEHMGAGAQYPLCDEPVFLSRISRAGYPLGFIPQVVARHPWESSGKGIANQYAMMSRGIAFREIFGLASSLVLNFVFYMKSLNKIKYNKLKALRDIYKGTLMRF